ncbi:hypothetical protein HZ71_005003, partial [Escherichia coli]|nr:hypothetical protein [Escherichia coli]
RCDCPRRSGGWVGGEGAGAQRQARQQHERADAAPAFVHVVHTCSCY